MTDDYSDLFEYHAPTAAQTEAIKKVRAALKDAYMVLAATIPPSAMRTLAIRKLEECSFWANKTIVFTDFGE